LGGQDNQKSRVASTKAPNGYQAIVPLAASLSHERENAWVD